eukprot:SAG25_NODE_8_length_29132_cov_108.213895_9_plen_45_part_00
MPKFTELQADCYYNCNSLVKVSCASLAARARARGASLSRLFDPV